MLSTDVAKARGRRPALIAVAVAGGLILLGIGIASMINLSPNSVTKELPGSRTPIITEITLATVAEEEDLTKADPALRQKSKYKTGEPLALRVTSAESVTEPFQVNARLIAESGAVVELSPSSLTFQPGTSTFCCWKIDQPDSYTLQIFRPEKFITSIPLVVDKSTAKPGGSSKVRFSF